MTVKALIKELEMMNPEFRVCTGQINNKNGNLIIEDIFTYIIINSDKKVILVKQK